MMTVPLGPAKGMASASECRWVTSTGSLNGTTDTVVDIRLRVSSPSTVGRKECERREDCVRDRREHQGNLIGVLLLDLKVEKKVSDRVTPGRVCRGSPGNREEQFALPNLRAILSQECHTQ